MKTNITDMTLDQEMDELNEMTFSFHEERMIWLFMRYPREAIPATTLCPADFIGDFYRSVFTAMLELWRDLDVEPMPVDVAIALQKKNALGDAETFQIEMSLSRLFHHGVASLANQKYYESEVKRYSEQRQLGDIIKKAGAATNGVGDVNVVAANLAMEIEAVKTTEGNDFLFDAAACVDDQAELMAANEEIKKSGGDFGATTGIKSLDGTLGAVRQSDVCVIAARPGVGKTAFGLTILLNEVRRNRSVLFVSTEMGRNQLMTRLLSMVSKIPHEKLMTCDLSEAEWVRYTKAGAEIRDYPFFILDKPICTPSEIMSYAVRLKKRGSLDDLIVDFLTRLTPDNKQQNRAREVGEMSGKIKQIAKSLDVSTFLLAQLNRDSAKLNKMPGLTDLRDSGEIEQDADQVVFLHRPGMAGGAPEARNKTMFLVSKNRSGQVGMASGIFADSIVTFVDSA